MNVTYSEKARQSGEGHLLLQRATKHLEEVLGPSADRVRLEWDRTEDEEGRPLYTLRLSDWTGSAAGSFTPDELASTTHMHYRLSRLWGALLQARSHKELEALQGASDPES